MRKSLQTQLMLLFLFLFSGGDELLAQCTTATINDGSLTPTTAWQTIATGNSGKRYRTFTATAGTVYEFSYCSQLGGGSSSNNMELTVLTSGNIAQAYNDDFNGSTFCIQAPYVTWACTVSGTYRIAYTRSGCNNISSSGTLAYRLINCATLGTGLTNVPSLPYNSGAGTTSGKVNDLNSANLISCGASNYLFGEDMVWKFTPASTGSVVMTLNNTNNSNNTFKLYAGCPLIGQGGTCVGSTTGSGNISLSYCLTSGVTYYLVLDVLVGNCNFSSVTISAPGGCLTGTGTVNIPSLPYSSSGRTTCGKVNDITATNAANCGNTNYYTGEDEVFIFTPASSGNISINLTSSGTRTGLVLYNGCPMNSSCTSAPSCIAIEQSTSGNKAMCANVTAGVTYYLLVDYWSTAACNTYSISIDAPVTTLPGSTCASAVTIASLPFVATGETTKCRGNDYTTASPGSCNTVYESGEDKVYQYTSGGGECIGITLTGANSNSVGFQVYKGCPSSGSSICIGSSGGASNGTLSGTITLNTAGTYYIVVDNQSAPSYVNYNISITSYGAGSPNDLPCNAIPLTLGISYIATNTCSAGSGETPGTPACWGGGGTRNTVWFSMVCPASGRLRVRAIPNSLTNPQIALYGGTCGTSMNYIACSDDAQGCGTTDNRSSDINVSGLTPGATYYCVVDGYGSLTGNFGILALDGIAALPALTNGQDCGTYIQVCDTTMSFGDPGFQSFGNICDFSGNGTNCLNAGERGSSWFEVTIAVDGPLEFSIIPKDWAGVAATPGNETDYDFAVWKSLGIGAVSCSDIREPLNAVPVKCNYSSLGLSGLYSSSTGNAPAQFPGYNGAFESQINALAGEKYIIVVSNYATSTSGFDIIFSNTSPISYGTAGVFNLNWSGGVDTDWFKKENWGGCNIPSCTYSAVVNGAIILQPVITAAATAKSVTINPGAVLTLDPSRTLSVCENFTNLGSFKAGLNSTVLFNNINFNQNIDGNLVAPNNFVNVTINKTGGIVKIGQDVEMTGNFNLVTAQSKFDSNGKVHKVGGNFINNGTYLTLNSLELNGTSTQQYTNFGTLKKIKINNTSSGGVHLTSDMFIDTDGSIELAAGVLHNDPFTEVQVMNRDPLSVIGGNNTSFVDGVLRRSLYKDGTLGTYNFPVGSAVKGYQLATVNFNNALSPNLTDNITAKFQEYSSLPSPLGSSTCSRAFTSPILNNGYWTFGESDNFGSGKFDFSLYPRNYNNADVYASIMMDDGFGWSMANGNCVSSFPVLVQRTAMTGLTGDFGIPQAPSPLPVELISFQAEPKKVSIQLNWTTATEKDNKGFEIQRLTSGGEFKSIGWVDGYGSSSAMHSYSFEDKNVEGNIIYYYRLRQVDFDGKYAFSPVVSAQLRGRYITANIFPNPSNDESVLTYYLEEDANVQISMVNSLGAEIMLMENTFMQHGNQQKSIKASDLRISAGLYTVRIIANGKQEYLKLLITGR